MAACTNSTSSSYDNPILNNPVFSFTRVSNSQFNYFDTFFKIAYGNNRWVAVGYNYDSYSGKMGYSNDGEAWTAIPSGNSNGSTTFGFSNINGIAYGNNRWVAVGSDGKMAYATVIN
jgi:hypothetical protein